VWLTSAGFLDRIREELRLQDRLTALGIAAEDVAALLAQRVQDTSGAAEEVRVDLSPLEHVPFINDLSRDKMWVGLEGCCDGAVMVL
jgi:hypothetical protein